MQIRKEYNKNILSNFPDYIQKVVNVLRCDYQCSPKFIDLILKDEFCYPCIELTCSGENIKRAIVAYKQYLKENTRSSILTGLLNMLAGPAVFLYGLQTNFSPFMLVGILQTMFGLSLTMNCLTFLYVEGVCYTSNKEYTIDRALRLDIKNKTGRWVYNLSLEGNRLVICFPEARKPHLDILINKR